MSKSFLTCYIAKLLQILKISKNDTIMYELVIKYIYIYYPSNLIYLTLFQPKKHYLSHQIIESYRMINEMLILYSLLI